MKLVCPLLALLLAICNGAELSEGNSEAAENFLNFFRSTNTVSREALMFLDNVFVEMAQYRCDVGGNDCAPLRVS